MLLAALAAAPALVGCATSSNLFSKDECKVYGGTRLDATLISEGFSPDPEAVKANRLEPPVVAWEACCGMFDLPLSVIADTVTLPITVPVTVARLGAPPAPSAASSKDQESTVPTPASPE